MKVPFPAPDPETSIHTDYNYTGKTALCLRCHSAVFSAPWLGGGWGWTGLFTYSKRSPQCSPRCWILSRGARKPLEETKDATETIRFWICYCPTSPHHWNANESISLAEVSGKAFLHFLPKGHLGGNKKPIPSEARLSVIRLSDRTEYILETFILCTRQWDSLIV